MFTGSSAARSVLSPTSIRILTAKPSLVPFCHHRGQIQAATTAPVLLNKRSTSTPHLQQWQQLWRIHPIRWSGQIVSRAFSWRTRGRLLECGRCSPVRYVIDDSPPQPPFKHLSFCTGRLLPRLHPISIAARPSPWLRVTYGRTIADRYKFRLSLQRSRKLTRCWLQPGHATEPVQGLGPIGR